MEMNLNQFVEIGAVYEHVGNKFSYRVLHVAQDDALQNHVVHQGLHDGRVWIRTVDNFVQRFERRPRF